MKPLREPGRFRIKQAALEELPLAARVKAAAWRESYPFEDEVFQAQDELADQAALDWEQAARRGGYFWVVVDTQQDGDIVGLAHAQVSDDPAAPTPLELSMIYLLDRAKGSGIADRLMEMTIGDAPAFLWVLEGNDRAIAFYERHGFRADGTTQELTGLLAGHRERRMVR